MHEGWDGLSVTNEDKPDGGDITNGDGGSAGIVGDSGSEI